MPEQAEHPSETVRKRIREELDGRIHGIAVTARRGNTSYCVASHSVDDDRGGRVQLSTVVVDLEAEQVRVHGDNSMWVPRESAGLDALTSVVARTTTDVSTGDKKNHPPTEQGVGVDDLLDTEVEAADESRDGQRTDMMKRHGGIDPSRSWGYGAGAPPEIAEVDSRLEDAGLNPSEHYMRLVFGRKGPMERRISDDTPAERPIDELKGNYGIELLPRDSGLVALDVDYPEQFPDVDLPESFAVSSPHGDDSRRHIILRCDEKEAIADGVTDEGEQGAWAVQSIDWGDLWIGDRFLAGPGCQLSEYGCDNGDHERGEPGGCEVCEDPERGFYRIVNDAPIATVEASTILDLLDASSGYDLRNGPADNSPPGDAGESDPRTCDNCGTTHDSEEPLKELSIGDSTRRICRGGCD